MRSDTDDGPWKTTTKERKFLGGVDLIMSREGSA